MFQKRLLFIFVHIFIWTLVVYFQSASQPDVSCHAIEPAHVAPEAAFPSLHPSSTEGMIMTRRIWKESGASRRHEACLDWHHPLLFLIRRWKQKKKKKKSGKNARILMQFGWKPKVFALGFFGSFTGYAKKFPHRLNSFYWRVFGSPAVC